MMSYVNDSWWKFVQSAPTVHVNLLSTIVWKDDAQPTVGGFPHPKTVFLPLSLWLWKSYQINW